MIFMSFHTIPIEHRLQQYDTEMLKHFLVMVFLTYILVVSKSAAKVCDFKVMKADIAFVLDSSSSIQDSEFPKIVTFLESFTDSVNVGINRTRIGVVMYARSVKTLFNIDDYADDSSLKNAIQSIQRTYGSTSTHLGIANAHAMFDRIHGQRPESTQKIIIILTDGKSSNGGATIDEAQKVRNLGIDVICIGISNNTNLTELSSWASSPQNVFYVDGFDGLHYILHSVLSVACADSILTTIPTVVASDISPSSSNQMYKLLAIIACCLLLVGASVCLCCACNKLCGTRSDDDDNEKKTKIVKLHDKAKMERRISPLSTAWVPKVADIDELDSMPKPMTERNAFHF